MSNANRDYVIIYDIKNSSLVSRRPLIFYITDENTSNIFVKLVTKIIVGDGIDQYTDIENASDYALIMRIIKPNGEVKSIIAAQHEPESIFQFDLTKEFKDIPGKYTCELITSTIVNKKQELTTSDPFNYEVKQSILSRAEIIEIKNVTTEDLLNRMDAVNLRIDNLIRLEDGSTTGDAELIDARIGADGNTYTNVGSAIRRQYSNLNSTFLDNFGLGIIQITPNAGYIRKDGYISTDATSYCYSTPIKVLKGHTINVEGAGYQQNVSMISTCDASGNNIVPKVISTDGELRKYSYTAQKDCYVIVSYYKGKNSYVTISYDYYNNSNIQNGISFSSNIGYIRHYGEIATDVDTFSYSEPIKVLKGQTINVIGIGYQQNVSMISTCDINGGNIVPKVISTDGELRKYSYTPQEDCYVIVSYYNRNKCVVTIDTSVIEKEEEKEEEKLVDYMKLFHRIGGIGDSLMSGELAYRDDQGVAHYDDKYDFSWLSNIARSTGATYEHYSIGGMTSKDWMADKSGLKTKLNNDTKCSAYFIGLLTNDANKNYSVGNITDEAGTDTFVGQFKSIIDLVRTKNPYATLFLVSSYSSDVYYKSYSDMVKNISALYNNCYFIDLINNSDLLLNNGEDFVSMGHFNALGYVKLSENIKDIANKEIAKNPSDILKFFGKYND